MSGLITALRTLTRIPVPGRDADNLAESLPWFPVVGALIGALAALLGWVLGAVLGWPAGAGVAVTVFSTLITGGLHLDGLGDTADSLGATTRERKLEIMKDPRIGSYGVMAIALALLIKAVAYTRLCELGLYSAILIPFVLSRTAQVGVAIALPYARAEGTARRFVEGASWDSFGFALILAAVPCLGIAPVLGAVSMLAAALVTVGLIRWMKRIFGGTTGDLLGMTSEVVEMTVAVALIVSVAVRKLM